MLMQPIALLNVCHPEPGRSNSGAWDHTQRWPFPPTSDILGLMATSLWLRAGDSSAFRYIVQPDSYCRRNKSRRKDLGPIFGVRGLIIGAPTSTSLALGASLHTCPQRTQWSPQAGGGPFLPWSVPDEQVGASCCGCSVCRVLPSPGALCDDGRELRPVGWRRHPH